MAFKDWLKTAWTDLLSWFSTEEQKVASFLYPIFQDAKVIAKKDLLQDVIEGLPIVIAALSGGIPAAITAAEGYIIPLLEKQGIQLATTTVNTLANALVAQAQAALAKQEATAGTQTATVETAPAA